MVGQRSYQGRIDGYHLDTETPAKIYLASVFGEDRGYSKWSSEQHQQEALDWFIKKLHKQVESKSTPHIAIVFPHTTRIFNWGEAIMGESTNIYEVGIAQTMRFDLNLNKRNLGSGILCDVDAQILAGEMDIRREANTLAYYLQTFVPNQTFNSFSNPGDLE